MAWECLRPIDPSQRHLISEQVVPPSIRLPTAPLSRLPGLGHLQSRLRPHITPHTLPPPPLRLPSHLSPKFTRLRPPLRKRQELALYNLERSRLRGHRWNEGEFIAFCCLPCTD